MFGHGASKRRKGATCLKARPRASPALRESNISRQRFEQLLGLVHFPTIAVRTREGRRGRHVGIFAVTPCGQSLAQTRRPAWDIAAFLVRDLRFEHLSHNLFERLGPRQLRDARRCGVSRDTRGDTPGLGEIVHLPGIFSGENLRANLRPRGRSPFAVRATGHRSWLFKSSISSSSLLNPRGTCSPRARPHLTARPHLLCCVRNLYSKGVTEGFGGSSFTNFMCHPGV